MTAFCAFERSLTGFGPNKCFVDVDPINQVKQAFPWRVSIFINESVTCPYSTGYGEEAGFKYASIFHSAAVSLNWFCNWNVSDTKTVIHVIYRRNVTITYDTVRFAKGCALSFCRLVLTICIGQNVVLSESLLSMLVSNVDPLEL